MEISGHQYAGGPILRKVQTGEALSISGVLLIASVLSDVDGAKRASTTAAAEALGVSLDAQATRNTAQMTDNSDPAVYVTVDVRPDQFIRARLSGSSTAGTDLTEFSNTTASTNGLLITTTANQSAYDDGYVIGATGANPGIMRKITAVTTTSTPIIAFPNDIAAGDTFYYIAAGPLEDAGWQLTSNIAEVDATGDNQAGTNLRAHYMSSKAKAERGASDNYVILTISDHLYQQ